MSDENIWKIKLLNFFKKRDNGEKYMFVTYVVLYIDVLAIIINATTYRSTGGWGVPNINLIGSILSIFGIIFLLVGLSFSAYYLIRYFILGNKDKLNETLFLNLPLLLLIVSAIIFANVG